jgi:hypothetical protein
MFRTFGFPTMDRVWTLDSKVKEYDNENEDGTLKIRVCQKCFSTFKTAPICPYCGAVYETTAIEIQNFKEIELRKIEEKKAARQATYANNIQKIVETYKSPKECRNWFELITWVRMKGYKPGYAFILNKQLKLNYKPYNGGK